MDELIARARRLIGPRRAVLGICGAPGAGKSTLAARLVAELGPEAVVVPLDGFHLDDSELDRLGRHDRKGAPDTFDADGYVALLRRINADTERPVYVPSFDREHELSLAGAIAVLPRHRLVVTEGNYLLLDSPGWREVRSQLTECWFVAGDDDLRRERLIARHVRHGRTPEAAQEWVLRSDEANARTIATTREAADLVVDPAAWIEG